MQKFIFVIGLLLSGCASLNHPSMTSHEASRGVAGAPSEAKVYLDTEEFPSKAQSHLLMAASGKIKLSAEQTLAALGELQISLEYEKLIKTYSERLYRELNVDPSAPHKWKEANPEISKGIVNYVGSSDEGMSEQDLSWQSLNIKLRSREALDPFEQNFLDEILFAIRSLPKLKGLVFRGQALTPQLAKAIKVGMLWEQPAFTSTSISYDVAHSFGLGHSGYSRRFIFIIKTKGGAPVSPMTFDHGYQGAPGRFTEYEVLLEPGAKLLVTNKIEDEKNDIGFIFAEEL